MPMSKPVRISSSSKRRASLDEMRAIIDRFAARLPLMANMVEGGKTPLLDASGLDALGFKLVIFPGGIARALAYQAKAYYRNLVETGSNQAFRDQMLDLKSLNEVLGTEDLLNVAKTYEGDKA